MLWHAMAPVMDAATAEQARLLGALVRAETLVRDAGDAYGAIKRTAGAEAARAMIAEAARRAGSESEKRAVEQIGR
jgi:hypothetical protein